MGDFRLKLKPTVQTSLGLLPAPDNFHDLVERVVRLDHAQYSVRKSSENTNHYSNASSHNKSSQRQQSAPPSSHSKHPMPQNASASHATTSRPSSSTSHLSHPCGPISQEEREHRLAHKLCMYCGDRDHAIQDCPRLQSAAKKGHTKQRANVHAVSASTSTPPSSTSSTTTVLPPMGNPPPQGFKRQDH